MAESSTTLKKGDNLPPRGRSKRTLILEAILESSAIGLPKNATKEQAEKAWFSELLKRALTPDDGDSGLCLRLLTERGWSSLKPSSDCVQFDFDEDGDFHKQAAQVMKAISLGEVPPDLGLAFVSGIKSMLDIEEVTELKGRLEAIEKELGINE